MVNSPMFTLSTRRWEVVSIAAVDMTIFGAATAQEGSSGGNRMDWSKIHTPWEWRGARGRGWRWHVPDTPQLHHQRRTHTHTFPPSPRTNTEQDHAEEK